jgi:hypothetical protein
MTPPQHPRELGHPEEAVDRDLQSRPGVPMVGSPPETLILTHQPLEPQRPTVEVLTSVDVGHLTPVFGTASPPHGPSGTLRRMAHRIPEHRARRWLLLLLSDRVDVWQGRIRRHPLLATAALVSTLILLGARRR